MRVKFMVLLAAAFCLFGAPWAQAVEPSAAGLWQGVDEETGKPTGWFLISDHNGVYDGIIAKMFLQPGEDPNAVCAKCSDDRKGMPWLGLPLIRGMMRHGLKYEGGSILDPRDGNVYHASMTVSPDGQTLVVRGFLGIELLGRNQYWHRLPESAYNELDPSINPKHPASAKGQPRKLDHSPRGNRAAIR